MAGQDADHPVIPADHSLGYQLAGSGDAGGTGRFAAEAACSHLGLGVEDLLLRDFANNSVADLERSQALVEIDRPVDLDGAGQRVGPLLLAVEFVVVVTGGGQIGPATLPAKAAVVVELVERVGTGGIDHRQPRHPVDQAEVPQFGKGLAEGT